MINVGCGSCGARSALSPSPAAPTTTGAPRSNLQNLTDTTPLEGRRDLRACNLLARHQLPVAA